jgi:hypothetical protein
MRAASIRAAEAAAELAGVAPAWGAIGSEGTGVERAERAGRSGTGTGTGTGIRGAESGGTAGRVLGGSGRVLVGAPGRGEAVELARGGGGCWVGGGSGVDNSPRWGMGGGLPGGREGSTLEPAGRGGDDTGRGGSRTGLGATAAVGWAQAAPARLSLSLAVPRSSPMEALCADPPSIAQFVLELVRGSGAPPRRTQRH